ncbi:MAG TPA: T9SS type A sorting domain-containing protein [Mucilaginibacter sp.]|nr:T9SS type A sorting domain-containing protein [Mucilaginibacter sp.]
MQINQASISGNINLIATGNNNTTTSTGGNANSGLAYPWFSVEKGKTTLTGQMKFLKGNQAVLDAVYLRNGSKVGYKGYGKFTADNTASSPSTLELLNKQPIFNTPLVDGFYVYFTAGGNNGTVLYDYPTGTDNQTIYTANEPSLTTTSTFINTTSPAYYNLTFSGPSKKVVNKNSAITGATPQGLSVGGNWNTSGGIVDLNTNDPIVTVTGDWTNSTTVNQDAGDIIIKGSVTNNSGGILNLGTANLSIGGNYTNNVGGIYTQSSGSTSFNGTGTQSLTDATPAGTKFNNVTFSNGSSTLTKVMNIGSNFSVAPAGVLTVNNSATLAVGSTTMTSTTALTLLSDATGDASIADMSAGSITGNINVQRYAAGGTLSRRSYRLLSAPVYQGQTAGQNSYGFKDLQATSIITGYGTVGTYPGGAPPAGFDPSPVSNPTVFFYNEPDTDPINKSIAASDYKGISTITDKFLVGNGFLFFFRGDRTQKDNSGTIDKTLTTAIPENTTLNFYGIPNQGGSAGITVYIPTSPISTLNGQKVYVTPTATANVSNTFSFTNNSVYTKGFHLVGNPYASAIDLEAIVTTNCSNPIYMLNSTGAFGAYIKTSNSPTLVNGVGRFVLSGQGFFIKGSSSSATLNIPEVSKKTGAAVTPPPTSFAVAKPKTLAVAKSSLINLTETQTADPVQKAAKELLISLSHDSTDVNETLITFGSKNNKYNVDEDAYYMSGMAQTIFMSSYTSDSKACIINQMGSLDSIKNIALYVEGPKDGIYKLKFTGPQSIDQRYKLYLVDNYTKDSLDLSANDTYNFNLIRSNTQTYGLKRFMLVRHDSGLIYNLLGFKSVKKNNTVVLTWKTEHEGDYTTFVLQRSTDEGKTFTIIDSLHADSSGNYTYTDNNPIIGINQYRLIQKISSESTKISNIVQVSFMPDNTSMVDKIVVYPNPASNIINVAIPQKSNATMYGFKIINTFGNIIKSSTSTETTWQTNVSDLLPGAYIIQVVNNNNNSLVGRVKFVKH